MTKEEIKAKLDEMGAEYDGRWSLERLEALLESDPIKETIEALDESLDALLEDEPPSNTNGFVVVNRIKHDGVPFEPGVAWICEDAALTKQLLEAGVIKSV